MVRNDQEPFEQAWQCIDEVHLIGYERNWHIAFCFGMALTLVVFFVGHFVG